MLREAQVELSVLNVDVDHLSLIICTLQQQYPTWACAAALGSVIFLDFTLTGADICHDVVECLIRPDEDDSASKATMGCKKCKGEVCTTSDSCSFLACAPRAKKLQQGKVYLSINEPPDTFCDASCLHLSCGNSRKQGSKEKVVPGQESS